LYTRTNNTINAPLWFLQELRTSAKNVCLDGELHTTRGDFQNLLSIVSKHEPVDTLWKTVKYKVFDLPSMGDQPFAVRYNALKEWHRTSAPPTHVKLVTQTVIRSREHLRRVFDGVLNKGGEGLMLRDPNSKYEQRRSPALLKYKEFKDSEAVVIGHRMGTGKFANVMGKLDVKWHTRPPADNLPPTWRSAQFSVGSGFTDEQRKQYKQRFPVGTVIKVKFFEINTQTAKPRFPTFLATL
jgi:DNA ligase-1